MNKKYEVVEFDNILANATQSLISGRPDLWDVLSTYETMDDADKAAREAQAVSKSRVAIREIGDRHPIENRYYNVIMHHERIEQSWDD